MNRKRDRPEEETHTRVEETYSEFRPKKLRVIVKEPTGVALLDEAAKEAEEKTILKILEEFRTVFLLNLKPGESKCVCERLILLLKSRIEHQVREIICSFLKSIFSRSPSLLASFETDILAQNLITLKRSVAKNAEIIPYLFFLWRQLVRLNIIKPGTEHFEAVRTGASEALQVGNWRTRTEALKILALCACKKPPQSHTQEKREELEEQLCTLALDQDPRVRAVAVKCLLNVSENWNLGIKFYPKIVSLMTESCDAVRRTCLLLLKHFSDANGSEEISSSNRGVTLRLVDDAFTHISHAMHDLSTQVRAEAASLLGQLTNVSQSFLEQTLDKKLMSSMKLMMKNRGRRDFLQEWSTGRRFGEDIPAEKSEEESLSLIPSGACGAFVVGLEDEFMVVRQASVRSLSLLAVNRPAFAAKALDFLTDMFNDEIEEVRLDAINSLKPLIQYSQLKEHQMETILNVLDEAMTDNRDALRELLKTCRVATVPSLKMTIDALLNNLKRYPADSESILRCVKALGLNHSAMVQPLVSDLLELHPFFDSPEPQIENPAYITKLVLVLNAASQAPILKALLPGHTWRHYRYLRDSIPHLVPPLNVFQRKHGTTSSEDPDVQLRQFLSEIQAKMVKSDKIPRNQREALLSLFTKDLLCVSKTESSISAAANYLYHCCKARSAIYRAIDAIVCNNTENVVDWPGLWRQLAELEFLHVSGEEERRGRFVAECEMRLVSLALLSPQLPSTPLSTLTNTFNTYQKFYDVEEENIEKDSLMDVLRRIEERKSGLGGGPDEGVENILKEFSTQLSQALLNSDFSLPQLKDLDAVKRKSCTVSEPNSNSDIIVKFVAGLVTSTQLTAILENFSQADTPAIRIRVCYPDQQEFLHKPRPSDFHAIGPGEIRLSTEILLSAFVWNESARVRMEVVGVGVGVGEGEGEGFASIISIPPTHPSQDKVSISLFPKIRC